MDYFNQYLNSATKAICNCPKVMEPSAYMTAVIAFVVTFVPLTILLVAAHVISRGELGTHELTIAGYLRHYGRAFLYVADALQAPVPELQSEGKVETDEKREDCERYVLAREGDVRDVGLIDVESGTNGCLSVGSTVTGNMFVTVKTARCVATAVCSGGLATFRCLHGDEEFVLSSEIGDDSVWRVNVALARYVASRMDRTRGCLTIDMDHDCRVFPLWAKVHGVGGIVTVTCRESYSVPVLWKTKYAAGIKLSRSVTKIVDLDQMGDFVTSTEAGVVGFAGEKYNFKFTNIPIVQILGNSRSIADVEVFGFLVRTGENGELKGRDIQILSRDRIFENVSRIMDAYGGKYISWGIMSPPVSDDGE